MAPPVIQSPPSCAGGAAAKEQVEMTPPSDEGSPASSNSAFSCHVDRTPAAQAAGLSRSVGSQPQCAELSPTTAGWAGHCQNMLHRESVPMFCNSMSIRVLALALRCTSIATSLKPCTGVATKMDSVQSRAGPPSPSALPPRYTSYGQESWWRSARGTPARPGAAISRAR